MFFYYLEEWHNYHVICTQINICLFACLLGQSLTLLSGQDSDSLYSLDSRKLEVLPPQPLK